MFSNGRSALILFTIVPFCFAPQISLAQSTKKTSYLLNTKSGSFVSSDPNAATIILHPRIGANVIYRYSEKTHFAREKKFVDVSAFKPGDPIIVRFKKSIVGPANASDVADKVSFDWLNRIRHEPIQVMIKEISEETLLVTEGADKAEIEYRITDKTQFEKSKKPATLTDFKVGDIVFIVPRSLASGAIQAVAVSDGKADAIHLKERLKTTVMGTIRTIDLKKMVLGLRSTTNDDRDFEIADDCTATLSGRAIPLTFLKPGLTVTLHLTKRDEDTQVVSKITVQSKKGSRKPALPRPVPPVNDSGARPIPKRP